MIGEGEMQKFIRLIKIWKLLREKRLMSAPKIAKMCRVTERTIYRDIQALCEAGVLLSCHKGYYIAEENPLPQFALTPAEQLALTLALQNLPLHLDKELEDIVNGLLNKLLERPAENPAVALEPPPPSRRAPGDCYTGCAIALTARTSFNPIFYVLLTFQF